MGSGTAFFVFLVLLPWMCLTSYRLEQPKSCPSTAPCPSGEATPPNATREHGAGSTEPPAPKYDIKTRSDWEEVKKRESGVFVHLFFGFGDALLLLADIVDAILAVVTPVLEVPAYFVGVALFFGIVSAFVAFPAALGRSS